MARYQLTSNPGYVHDTETGAFVPRTGTYQSDQFQAWLDQGHVPDPVPALSPEEILSFNMGRQRDLLRDAGEAIAPLQDATDLGVSTREEANALNDWKAYRVQLNRTDTSVANPAWPAVPGQSAG